jgi:hypothetical protein
MEPPRQKWIARIVLLLGAASGALWLGHLDLRHKISTDVLDLVPTDERSPELSLVKNLAGQEQARVLLLALRLPAKTGESDEKRSERTALAAALFSKALLDSPAIVESIPLSDSRPRDALAAAIYSWRFDLLLPGWLDGKRHAFEAAGTAEPTCPSPRPWPHRTS